MKNEQIIWSKVLLVTYKYLGRLSSTIDKLVEKTAKNSMHTTSIWRNECSIMSVSNKIIKLSNKKIDYINLKITIEKALKKMPLKYSKILILKYIHNISIDEIEGMLNLSKRSVYRKMDEGLLKFFKNMGELGFTKEFLEITYSQDSFIASVYESISIYRTYAGGLANVTCDDFFNKYLYDFALKPV